MPKKGTARKFNLRKVLINSSMSPGALATLDVAAGLVTDAVVNSMRFMSLNCSYTWADIQADIDDGMVFGVAHGDYTAAEIEECLESFASISPGNKIAQEQAGRLVRSIGTISSAGQAAGGGVSFNDGKRIKTRLNWLMVPGDRLNLWVRNSSGVVWTTGSGLLIAGDLWVKDSA